MKFQQLPRQWNSPSAFFFSNFYSFILFPRSSFFFLCSLLWFGWTVAPGVNKLIADTVTHCRKEKSKKNCLPPSILLLFIFYFILLYFILFYFTCYGSLSRSTALSFLTASDEAHLVHFYSLVFCFNVCYYPEARMSTLLSNGIGISYCLVVRNSRLINVEKLDSERTDLIVVLFLQLHRWR